MNCGGIVSLFLLVAAVSLFSPGFAQDLQSMNDYLQSLKGLETLDSMDDSSIDKLQEALSQARELWTLRFNELATKNGNFLKLSQQCIDSALSMDSLVNNVTVPGRKWLTVLDDTGKPGAGLEQLNSIMNGAYDACFTHDYTGFCLAQKVHIRIPEVPLPPTIFLTMGLCVPKHCNATDMGKIINVTEVLYAEEGSVYCSDTKTVEYNVGGAVMTAVCLIFLLLVLTGTIMDCSSENLPKLLAKEHHVMVSPSISSVNNNNTDDESKTDEKTHLLSPSAVMVKERCGVHPLDFIVSFSLFKTVPTLLATKQAPSVITSLNGLRVLSMFWVILGHTHFWLLTGVSARVDNIAVVHQVMSRFSFQAVGNAFFAVDSFFFLSGVLVAYLTLRQMQRRNGRFPFLPYYIHRYLRITPTYAFVIFFAWFLGRYLFYGPLSTIPDGYHQTCYKYWWTNLLYINNLYPWKMYDECLPWSWYLANDMQFYIITPLILLPAYYLFPVGLAVAGAFLSSGFLITAVLVGVFDFQANTFSQVAYNYSNRPGAPTTSGDAIYIKPWDRIGPYIVGVVLGYVLFKQIRIKLSRKLMNVLAYSAIWAVAGFVMFWIIYGLYFTWHGHFPTTAENVVYVTFSRFLWAVCLAMIIFACHNGYGWFVNSFLSMPLWTPLSRLTFNAYLLHPIVMTAVYGQLQTSIHYTDVTMAAYFIVFVVLSYASATLVCLVVEFPLGTIETLVFRLFGSSARESQRQSTLTQGLSKERVYNINKEA